MRLVVVVLALAATLAAQDGGIEDEGVEVSEDPPEKPRTLNEASGLGLLALREAQAKDGSWNQRQVHTGLALCALAAWGQDHKDPAIVSGVAWIHKDAKERSITGRYDGEAGPACIVLALAAVNRPANPKTTALSENPNRPPRGSRFDKDDWRLMHEYVTLLTTDTQGRGGRAPGFKACFQDGRGGWGAGSPIATTHLVLTALREAMLAGYPVRPETLTKALGCVRKWRDTSGLPGAYSVLPADDVKGMVCAWICREGLTRLKDPKNGLPEWSGPLTDGSPQVTTLFVGESGKRNAIGCDRLWAVEQLGSITAAAAINGANWYDDGTRYLLRHAWGTPDREGTHVLETSFALLFLKRSTTPLVREE